LTPSSPSEALRLPTGVSGDSFSNTSKAYLSCSKLWCHVVVVDHAHPHRDGGIQRRIAVVSGHDGEAQLRPRLPVQRGRRQNLAAAGGHAEQAGVVEFQQRVGNPAVAHGVPIVGSDGAHAWNTRLVGPRISHSASPPLPESASVTDANARKLCGSMFSITDRVLRRAVVLVKHVDLDSGSGGPRPHCSVRCHHVEFETASSNLSVWSEIRVGGIQLQQRPVQPGTLGHVDLVDRLVECRRVIVDIVQHNAKLYAGRQALQAVVSGHQGQVVQPDFLPVQLLADHDRHAAVGTVADAATGQHAERAARIHKLVFHCPVGAQVRVNGRLHGEGSSSGEVLGQADLQIAGTLLPFGPVVVHVEHRHEHADRDGRPAVPLHLKLQAAQGDPGAVLQRVTVDPSANQKAAVLLDGEIEYENLQCTANHCQLEAQLTPVKVSALCLHQTLQLHSCRTCLPRGASTRRHRKKRTYAFVVEKQPIGQKLFRKFCDCHAELKRALEFLDKVSEYELMLDDDRPALAVEIFKEFLRDSSECVESSGAENRESIRGLVDQLNGGGEPPSKDLFSACAE
uniref:RGS domain-containing protein n=1 Tax=Macrostomum lignano TaxID=282301 RepID=A0A1I8JL33_9PLAT